MRFRKQIDPLPKRFYELREYRRRVVQGIEHTPEYEKRMAVLQEKYDRWLEYQHEEGRHGGYAI